MSVYFIACAGFIKVGFSDDPEKRCKNLFKGSSRYSAPRAAYEARGTQHLLRAIAGDKGTETNIQDALADFYAGCEWFVDEPALRDYIATVQGDEDRWSRRTYPRLVRDGGPAQLPQHEMGGSNYALNVPGWTAPEDGAA